VAECRNNACHNQKHILVISLKPSKRSNWAALVCTIQQKRH